MAESSNHWSDAELREKVIAEVLAQVQGLEYDRCDIEAALRHRESMDSEIVCCVDAVEGRLLAEQQRDQARELLEQWFEDCGETDCEMCVAVRKFLATPAADAKGR